MANNQYHDSPPIMADGRLFSAYFPKCLQEYAVFDDAGKPLSSYEYRQYLIQNASQLLDRQRADAARLGSSCTHYDKSYPSDHRVQSCATGDACAFSPVDASGLGLRRS